MKQELTNNQNLKKIKMENPSRIWKFHLENGKSILKMENTILKMEDSILKMENPSWKWKIHFFYTSVNDKEQQNQQQQSLNAMILTGLCISSRTL